MDSVPVTTPSANVKAVIYARRSQVHQDASVDTQVEQARRFIEKKGWTLLRVYRDDESHTGRREFKRRKQFLKLLADSTEGDFSVVVARDTSRLGGDTSRVMRAVEDLSDEGVALWTYIDDREIKLEHWTEKAMFALQSAARRASGTTSAAARSRRSWSARAPGSTRAAVVTATTMSRSSRDR